MTEQKALDKLIQSDRGEVLTDDLPVQAILEVIQMSEDPRLSNLDDQKLYRIHNALKDDVQNQLLPKWTLTRLRFSDRCIQIDDQWYAIRKVSTGDIAGIAEAAPAVMKFFFDDQTPEQLLENKTMQQAVLELFSKATAHRIKGAMTAIGYTVIEILASLLVWIPDEETFKSLKNKKMKVDYFIEKYLDEDKLVTCDPEELTDGDPIETHQAVASILAVNAFFFVYIEQQLPANQKNYLSMLNGILTTTTGIDMKKVFTKELMKN